MSKEHSLSSVAGGTAEKCQGSSPITDNDWHILVWLLHHPFQRICDIALGLDSSDRTIARAVHHLQAQQMVEYVTPSNNVHNRHRWYYLSSRGISFLAQQEDGNPRQLARTWQVGERHLLCLLPRFHHLVQLQQIIQRLIQSAPVALSYAGKQATIRWGWKRDYVITICKRQHTIKAEVDAAIVLRRRPPAGMLQSNETEQFFVVFMYLDMGQIDRATMLRRLRHLLLYRESRERQPYHSLFPLIIVMVESQRQLELWQWAAAEAAKQLRLGKPLLGVITTLTDAQEPQSLWQANWRHLTTNAFCHLQEMLVPMHAAAVPPGIMTDHPPHHRLSSPSVLLQRSIVRGQYHERLEQFIQKTQTGQPLSAKQEQEGSALLGLQMPDRYREIVQILSANPLLKGEELAIISQLQLATAGRYVRTLEKWGCVQPFKQQQNSETDTQKATGETRWGLSRRGFLYLTASTTGPSQTSARKKRTTHLGKPTPTEQKNTPASFWQPGIFQLYREWQHTAGVYQCVVAFFRAAKLHPYHRISWFETHFRCARRYRVNGGWHNFRPDAVLEYIITPDEHTMRRFHLWIEWENGTMKNTALRTKFQAYRFYMRSLEWRRRQQRLVVPILVVIVPRRSKERITHVLQEVLQDSGLHVRLTTQELWQEYGVLAQIWTEVVPSLSGCRSDLSLFETS